MSTVPVVIVGGGIAGLAAALAFHRAGVRSLVLERHHELRGTGATITLQPNAWSALRILGVADKLASRYYHHPITRVTDLRTGQSNDIPLLGKISESESGVKTVHRKALMEALAEDLPSETIRFSSRVVSIKTDRNSVGSLATVHLDDDTIVHAKLLIGCDGIHSIVGQWLGLSETIKDGRSAVRGVASYPEGHGFRTMTQFLSKGIRAVYIPLNEKEVYWAFLTTVVPDDGIYSDPKLMRQEAVEKLTSEYPAEYSEVVQRSDLDNLTWMTLQLRLPWDIVLRQPHHRMVTVTGDAFHPMTPDLGQGGGMALEDAIVLVQSLAQARTVEEGVAVYVAQRKWRVARVTAGSWLVGWVQEEGVVLTGMAADAIRWFRDHIFYKFFYKRISEEFTRFDSEQLPKSIGCI